MSPQLSIKGRRLATLRVTPQAVQASRPVRLSLPGGVACVVRLVGGLSAAGVPMCGFDVDSVSPPPLVAAAAAGLLATGKTLSGAKAVPLFTVAVPGLYVPWRAQAEVRAAVARKGDGVVADVKEVNFVLDV